LVNIVLKSTRVKSFFATMLATWLVRHDSWRTLVLGGTRNALIMGRLNRQTFQHKTRNPKSSHPSTHAGHFLEGGGAERAKQDGVVWSMLERESDIVWSLAHLIPVCSGLLFFRRASHYFVGDRRLDCVHESLVLKTQEDNKMAFRLDPDRYTIFFCWLGVHRLKLSGKNQSSHISPSGSTVLLPRDLPPPLPLWSDVRPTTFRGHRADQKRMRTI
jgi:hypothetical protein